MKFASYYSLSLASLLALVYYAYYTQKQFYPTVLYLVSSKLSYVVAGNMMLASGLLVSRFVKSVYFGSLREAEVELLVEKGKYVFIETCFALTIFRNELTSPVLALFGALIFLKLLHKLSKCRMEYLEQIMPVPLATHCRVAFLLATLVVVDVAGAFFSLQYILKHGRSVLILFGFEFGLQLVYAANLSARFAIQVADAMLPNGLTSRGLYLMLADLVCEVVKLATYIAFFCLVFVYYGVPIHILRDVYAAYLSFYRKLVGFIKYLRLTRNLNSRFPDATPDEIAAAGSCLVCREDMDGSASAAVAGTGSKKLPCGHVFHLDCLRMWLQHQQACPLCRADIPVAPVAGAAVPADNAAQPAALGANAVVPPEAPLPQDIHVARRAEAAAATTPAPLTPAAASTSSAATPATAARSEEVGEEEPEFPAFFVVSAERDLAVLSDPSRLGSELRRVAKGTVLFVTMRVVEQDGTQWLRGPDGWLLEKVLLCGTCCTSSSSAAGYCSHEAVYVSPLLDRRPTVASRGGQGRDTSREPAVAEGLSSSSSSYGPRGAVYSRSHMLSRYQQFSSSPSSSGRPAFSAELTADEPGVGCDRGMGRLSWQLEGHRVQMDALRGESWQLQLSSAESLQQEGMGAGGEEARLQQRFRQMLVLQSQMAEITARLVDLNQSVLACQQSISQLIKDEIHSVTPTPTVAVETDPQPEPVQTDRDV